MSEDGTPPAPSFSELTRALQRVDPALQAAESHGVLCGALCAPQAVDEETWAHEILGETAAGDVPAAQCRSALHAAHADLAARLRSPECDFQPLLPADSAPLAARCEALAVWCSGFLFGLGLGGLSELEPLPSDTQELIRDLLEFTRLEADGEEDEGAEAAFAELVEYVRVGVLLINEELHPRATGPAADGAVH